MESWALAVFEHCKFLKCGKLWTTKLTHLNGLMGERKKGKKLTYKSKL